MAEASARASAALPPRDICALAGLAINAGDVVPETALPQIHLAQSVEEQQAGHHRRILELPLHEFERRQRADLEQAAARRLLLEKSPPLGWRQRWRAIFGQEDAGHDGDELVVPAAQRLGIAPAELRDGIDRTSDIRPPLERAAVAGEERDVELRLDVVCPVALEIKISVPRHGGDGPLEKRVRVVQEAGMTRVLECGEPAAGDRRPIDRKDPEARLAEIGGQDQRVMAGADDDAVVATPVP